MPALQARTALARAPRDAECTRGRRRCPSGSRRRSPARIAAIASSTVRHAGLAPSTTRSRPARSFVPRTSRVAELVEETGHARRGSLRRSRARARRPAAAPASRRARSPRSRLPRRARPAAPTRAPRARGSRSRRARRTAGSRRRGPTALPAVRRRGHRARARPAAPSGTRSPARPRAHPLEASIAVTFAPGCSSAIASAIAPLPVPTSSTRGSLDPGDPREAALDDDLRLGPRHEHPRVDLQRQPPEPPLAEHVGERLAYARGGRPGHSSSASAASSSSPAAVRLKATPGRAEHVGEQDLGVDARRVAARRGEPLRDVARRAAAAVRHAEAAASACRRSSAWSASVNSPRSPSSAWSSRCAVSLIRWSVTRLSGKL